MKSTNILLSPTAKLTIGDHSAITLDTATKNGKKSIQLNFETEDDTVSQAISQAVSEVKDEVEDMKEEFRTEIREERDNMQMGNDQTHGILALSLPIISVLAVFSFLAFRSYQNRKWKEALLSKGMNVDDIDKLTKNNLSFDEKMQVDDVQGYEKRKSLKYMIVFFALGAAILLSKIFESAGMDDTFWGFLFVFLGMGFYYYQKKTN